MFGKVTKINGNKIEIELDEEIDMYQVQRLSNGKQPTVEIAISDGRIITPDQRKKIYALINDLCDYTGDLPEYWKIRFKFAVEMIFKVKPFSLSNCSVTVGNYMILTILNFMFENNIPFKTKTWDAIPDDFPKQMLCLKNKQCVICGKPADIAHYNAVGMGRNRNKIDHVGMYIMTLCRIHHDEQHHYMRYNRINNFFEKYHIKPIKVTPEIAKRFKLGRVKDDE
ncbi:putative HNHc nuclease [Ligilactobacillus sp. LYQ135]